MTRPRALLFDFGGTLDGSSHWLDRFLAQYRAAGFEISRAELDPAFTFATRAGYAASSIVSRFKLGELVRFLAGNQVEYLRREGSEQVRGRLEQMGADGRFKLVERIRDSFLKETTEGLRRSREVLKSLRPQFKIGVVSNWYGNLDLIIAEAGMKSLVDAVTDSSRVGACKPGVEIFAAALEALAIRAQDAAMVGDSILKDCAPAHRLGMRTVWLHAAGPNGVDGVSGVDFSPDYQIGSLEELLRLGW